MDLDFRLVLEHFDPAFFKKRIKLVRHAHATYDLSPLIRLGFLSEYEERQAKPIFDGVEAVLSFMGEGRTRSRFVGASLVGERRTDPGPYPAGFPFPNMGLGKYRYELHRQPQFAPMHDRLVIDWGESTRSWHQHLRPKDLLEIRPRGHVAEFPGYDDVLLDFHSLERVIQNPDANRAWHLALRAVAGVYLIVDTEAGSQYVGSAYGEGGLLARWTSYVKTLHGGNVRLKALLQAHPGRHRAFQFTILRTLPKSMTSREVIEVEGLQKVKLGTRAFGLNSN